MKAVHPGYRPALSREVVRLSFRLPPMFIRRKTGRWIAVYDYDYMRQLHNGPIICVYNKTFKRYRHFRIL